MEKLLNELEQRWATMFSALASGGDVPPSLRLRAEGMMESVILMDIATTAELDQTMNQCYHNAYGKHMLEDLGSDWREFYPFPQIPAMGRRAPVYPSTKD